MGIFDDIVSHLESNQVNVFLWKFILVKRAFCNRYRRGEASLSKTVRLSEDSAQCGQISRHIFTPNWGYRFYTWSLLCNGFVRLRFHRVIQQQYDSYTPQLTSGGLKPGLSGLRDLSASTDFILLNFALAKDTFLLTSSGLRVHVMSASSQISSCINNSSTSSRVIMPTTRYEDNTKLRFVKRNVTRSRPAH